jgi:hypothetical protein
MTASNQTYSRLSLRSDQPGSGIGTPQSRSRLMARGLRSSSRFWLNFRTFGRQSVRDCSHDPSDSAKAGSSRKNCADSTNFGGLPSIFDRGLIRSCGSSWLPQLSHWSPRAPS